MKQTTLLLLWKVHRPDELVSSRYEIYDDLIKAADAVRALREERSTYEHHVSDIVLLKVKQVVVP